MKSSLINELDTQINKVRKLEENIFNVVYIYFWYNIYIYVDIFIDFETYTFSLFSSLTGEYVFMDCSSPSIVSNQILSSGATKSCKANYC